MVKKIGAYGILFTMISGFIAEARIQIKQNSDEIIVLKTENKNNTSHMTEIKEELRIIRGDIKLLLQK